MALTHSSEFKVAVIGASGYGGIQLVRLLKDHPNFQVTFLGGERTAGKSWNELFPFLPLSKDILIQASDPEIISNNADFVVLSLPNGLA